MDCTHLKAGDKVWVGHSHVKKELIKPVLRVTPTQVVLDWNGDGKSLLRMKRSSGFKIDGGWNAFRITGIPTPKEVAAFEAKQLAEKLAQEEAKRKKEEADRLIDSLNIETPPFCYVSEEQYGGPKDKKDKFVVDVHFLTADQVLCLVQTLKRVLAR